MTQPDRGSTIDLDGALALETAVWDSLVAGDAAVDRSMLADHFVGVYPTGFAGADEHAGQLADGPTVASYTIGLARLLDVADGHVMLCYLARYRRAGRTDDEQMYVSSLWSFVSGRWLNVFSQDTPVGASVV